FNTAPTVSEAAEKFDTTPDAVKRGKQVLANGTPALQEAVKDDVLTVTDAAKVAKEAPEVQDAAVDAVRRGRAERAAAAACQIKEREPGDIEELTDAEGEPVPEQAIEAFKAAKVIEGLCREMDALIRRVEDVAKGPGGRLIRMESVRQHLKDAKGNLWANR